MRGFLFNNVLALILLGSSLNLYGANPFCPVNNTVTLTCNDVAMEALWARLGNDMNSLFATNNAPLINAINGDASQTYRTISNICCPGCPPEVLFDPFNNWWLQIDNFYNQASNSLPAATTSLAQALYTTIVITGVLGPKEQQQLSAQLTTSFTNLLNNMQAEYNSYITGQYDNGIVYSAAVLKDISFIGVTVGKALEGVVVTP